MKKLILLFLLMLPLTGIAQSNLRAFWRPVRHDLFPVEVTTDRDITADQRASLWLPRPAFTITAIKWYYNKELGKFESSNFNSVGVGFGYQHFVATGDGPYNNYGANLLLMLGENICAGLTISGFEILNIGVDYNFTLKRVEYLTGVTLKF